MTQSSFYLNSRRNVSLYRESNYPLTHCIGNENVQDYRAKRSKYVKHFTYASVLFLFSLYFGLIVVDVHTCAYNIIFGPFHLNLDELEKHIKSYEASRFWHFKKVYIQVELGEDQIKNPLDTESTIRKYSNHWNHIATFKYVSNPKIYVKFPTRSNSYFHKQQPFQFSQYSIRTLKCIVKQFGQYSLHKSHEFLEKSEYVTYINEQYAKDSASFNKATFSKCGILIGYLYCPVHERAYVSSHRHQFYKTDLALEASKQYCAYQTIIFFALIYLVLWVMVLFNFLNYSWNAVRLKILQKFHIFPLPLSLNEDIIRELSYLNMDSMPHQQLLRLDEFIQQTEHKFHNQLFIIENDHQELFLVLLRVNLDEYSFLETSLSPFIICDVNQIKRIVPGTGIYYGSSFTLIPWPHYFVREQNHAAWLHGKLMDISENYRRQQEYYRQLQQRTRLQSIHYQQNENQYSRRRTSVVPQRNQSSNIVKRNENSKLTAYIEEERQFQRARNIPVGFITLNDDFLVPASTEFIARFRIDSESNKQLVDASLERQQQQCTICLEVLKLNEVYAKWPCPSRIPHIFHFECIWQTLRTTNRCPLCRHPVEANQSMNLPMEPRFEHLLEIYRSRFR